MKTATRTHKPARETHGTARLIPSAGLTLQAALDTGVALLALYPEHGEPTSYTVKRLTDGDGSTVGFSLTRLAAFIIDRKTYDIDVTPGFGWQCDCPDAQYRSRECKHVRALRAALARCGITIPAPQQQAAQQCNSFDDL